MSQKTCLFWQFLQNGVHLLVPKNIYIIKCIRHDTTAEFSVPFSSVTTLNKRQTNDLLSLLNIERQWKTWQNADHAGGPLSVAGSRNISFIHNIYSSWVKKTQLFYCSHVLHVTSHLLPLCIKGCDKKAICFWLSVLLLQLDRITFSR